MQGKTGPAASLWAFCPCSGRRLAHRGSCYNFHFLNIFLPFFFSCMEPRRVFYPSLQHEDEGRGGARWQLRFGLLSLQLWQTNKVQTAHGCRVAVVRCRHSGSVDHSVWSGGGLVTWAICEPQDRWGDASQECEVYFIIPYPIPLPLVVSATSCHSPKPPRAWRTDVSVFGLVDLFLAWYGSRTTSRILVTVFRMINYSFYCEIMPMIWY